MSSPAPGDVAREPRPARVEPRSVDDVAARLRRPGCGPVTVVGGDGAAAITGLTLDSRAVRPGDLYAALPGTRVHGADFSAAAGELGAVAVLTDEAGRDVATASGLAVVVVDQPRSRLGELAAWLYGDPATALTTVGVTGTNGKTTTTFLLDAVLRGAGLRTGLIGTIETRVGGRQVPSVRTTPEAPALQSLLAVMRDEGVDAVAMEVSSHALVLGRVDGMVFDVGVFLNLSQDHLDFHADLEDYFAAKASLFTPSRCRRGVGDVDDPDGARSAADPRVPLTTVAPAGATADWRVTASSPRPGGATAFTLAHRDGRELHLVSPLAGGFNLANTALAAVAALEAGVGADLVPGGLLSFGGVPGRMERVLTGGAGAPDQPLAFVDFAHTPVALASVLGALRPVVAGRLVAVVGAGGDRDPGKRAAMGAAVAAVADVVVVTDDNPRSEDPAAIRAAVLGGARGEAAARGGVEVVEVADRSAAIAHAVRVAGASDAVVVLGRGHEQGQEVAGDVVPFDDRVVLREQLAALAGATGGRA